MKRLLSVLPILAALLLCYACDEEKAPENTGDDTTITVDEGWGGTDPGSIYLGITGFNEVLYTCPIKKLTRESRPEYDAFIDGLSKKGATVLCWAADQSLDAFRKSRFPGDLSTAAIVTFTDGRDQGSMGYSDRYSTRNAYLDAMKDRIETERVSGVPITAYSIGLRGIDVMDDEVEDFRRDLERLASEPSEEYAFFVENMEEVNKKFQEIAQKLSRSWNVQSVTLRIPVPGEGTRVRFTFDEVTSATASSIYIDGYYNKGEAMLTDLTFKGMKSPWTWVKGEKSGPYVTFTFTDLQKNEGVTLTLDDVQEWLYEPEETRWKVNSEFRPDDLSNGIAEEIHSAAVMLLLDCSTSLGSDFDVMRLHAKSFINTLLRGTDPTAVMSVSLNKPTLTLETGRTETLIATVLPTTAKNKNVTWSSDKTAIATVDSKGMVKGVSPGVATIKAKTVDGGYEATCTVTVVNSTVAVTSVTVSPSTLTLNEGATSTLTATVSPSNATDKTVAWSSTNGNVATVDQTGKVTAVKEGSATIVASCGGKSGSCTVTVNKDNSSTVPSGAVDLGLPSGLKWSSCNLGASKPEDYGDYYAWGETAPKSTYNWSTYKWCNGSYNSLTRYCPSGKTSYWGGSGNPDNKTSFKDYDYADDAARKVLGGKWRMPTDDEWTELRNNCTWVWTDNYNGTGVKGRVVTASNGNSIFLPAAGYRYDPNLGHAGSRGYYWSSSLLTGNPDNAWSVYFGSGDVGRSGDDRYYGQSVRPVSE